MIGHNPLGGQPLGAFGAGSNITSQLLAFTNAGTITIRRNMDKRVPILSGETISKIVQIAWHKSFFNSEIVSIVRPKFSNLLKTMSMANVLTKIDQIGWRRSLNNANTLLFAQLKVRLSGHFFDHNITSTLTYTRGLGAFISLASAILTTVPRSVGHFVRPTLTNLLTLPRSIGKILLVPRSATLSVVKQISKAFAFTSTNTQNILKAAQLLRSSLLEVTSEYFKPVNKRLVIASTQVFSIRKNMDKAFVITSANASTIHKNIVKTFVMMMVVTALIYKRAPKLFVMTQANILTFFKPVNKRFTANLGNILRRAWSITKAFMLVNAMTLTVRRNIARLFSFSHAVRMQQLIKTVGKRFTANLGNVLRFARSATHAIATFNANTLTTIRKKLALRTLLFVSANVLTYTKPFQRTIMAPLTIMARATKSVGHFVRTFTANTLSRIVGKAQNKLLTISNANVFRLTRQVYKVIATVTNQNITRFGSYFKTIRFETSNILRRTRAMTHVIRFVQGNNLSAIRSFASAFKQIFVDRRPQAGQITVTERPRRNTLRVRL